LDIQADPARRSALLEDDYVLAAADEDIVNYLLSGQNHGYSPGTGGAVTWGAFGHEFTTLGQLRAIAREYPAPVGEPEDPTAETVGLELFGNMLDTIAFLRVRLRTLADVCIEKGIVTGPELLGKYHDYHEKSFEAFRDLMLLRPEVFERRFAGWLATEKDYRDRLAADIPVEP
jgi:hypothetical protein